MKSNSSLSIGQLANRFGLDPHVLRHWESQGLLSPGRDAVGHRSYGGEQLGRVALILMGKEAGFTLRQLRVLLSTGNPMDHRASLRQHVRELERRIERATAAKDLIEHALSCPVPFDECEHAQQRIARRIPAA